MLAGAAGTVLGTAGCSSRDAPSSERDDVPAEDDAEVAARPTPVPPADAPITNDSDVVYRETDERSLQLDLVRPDDEVHRPVLVHLHGGGWRRGDKGYEYAGEMARAGMAVATLQYRLSGEAPYPAAVHDVVAGIKWLRTSGEERAIDPDRLALVGESAGGHLATLVANAPNHEAFQPPDGPRDVSAAVDAVVSVSGIYDLTHDGICDAGVTEDFLGGSCTEHPTKARTASPVTHVDEAVPPTLLYHGTADEAIAHEQASIYRTALANANVDVSFESSEGGDHLLGEDAAEFLPTQREFLQRTLDVGE